MRIATHNGRFHIDELFGLATVMLAHPGEHEVIRTRDMEVIASADVAIDVGGIYEPSQNRFDHHQEGGAGVRASGIPYSSFGLVWQKFGEQLTGSKDSMLIIDKKIVEPIDAVDNGVDIITPMIPGVYPYLINALTGAMMPTWQEPLRNLDKAFKETLGIVRRLLEREIAHAKDFVDGQKIVKELYEKSLDKQIIEINGPYPWGEVLAEKPEPLYVIYPERQGNGFRAQAVRDAQNSFRNRKDFPSPWAGKTGGALAEVTGVPDALFCHNKRWVVAAKSLEGARALAKLAVEAKE